MRVLVYKWAILASVFSSSCKHEADGYPIKGIDVSHYQGYVNWMKVERHPNLKFVFVKATEGRSHKDRFFKKNWAELGNTKLYRGAYHFFRANIGAEAQAKNFIESVHLEAGDLPPVLDVETLNGVSVKDLRLRVKEWLRLVESNYGVKPIIYTGDAFYRSYLKGHVDGYVLWIARYNRFSPKSKSWHFWQYKDWGSVNGISTDVDMNVFDGGLGKLEAIRYNGVRG